VNVVKFRLLRPGAVCAAFATLIFLAGCIRDVQIVPDIYTPFPEPIILGSSFYYQRNGKDVTGDDAGTISKNDDGTYKVRIRRRSPSNAPTAIFITGSFEFSDYYKITCTFPDDPAIIDKPYRVYACASRYLDMAVDADYATARDLKGQAVFRNGVAIGTFEMSNEGVNILKPDRKGRPYITVFLYLYFNNVSDPDDYYEFTLDYVGGAHGVIPKSKVVHAALYRDGDTAAKIELPSPQTLSEDSYILARYNLPCDSGIIGVSDTMSLNLDLAVPDEDAGKEIQFEIRNPALFSGGANLITRDMINAAKVLAGTTEDEQTGVVTEMTINSTPVSYYYRVNAKTVAYGDFTGIKLVFLGNETEPFTDTDRFACTLYLPDTYTEEAP